MHYVTVFFRLTNTVIGMSFSRGEGNESVRPRISRLTLDLSCIGMKQ